MSKKWEEIEFLDLRERQIRRRTAQTRALTREEQERSPPGRGLKVVFALAILVGGGAAAYGIWSKEIHAWQARLFRSRTTLDVVEVIGDVEVSTPTRAAGAPRPGDRFDDAITVQQGENARLTLSTYWPDSRIVVRGPASVQIGRITPVLDEADTFRVTIGGKRGECIVEFRTGRPRVELELPQRTVVRASRGLYRVTFGESESAIVVRDGMALISTPDQSRTARILPDRRLVVRADHQWEGPTSHPTSDAAWR